ncbi:putative flagellar hook-associated protein FlgL [Hyphomonas neptunium ATCC 15444]|uniref:Putative flagellar hook-associated protein FlgL n=2 Tax=Hyphomonas TaxID=85 RepID=Q0C5L4_HYPNA|nr:MULTISPECIES: flagellin [Hyphomonas]ABI76758.1 putative flagellar hook-associated protein FlgL [Hyphomonas neptunium ATCC 15444]KCZ95407.1 putative flagellar hook-associated protein FlgL [Hyphomonas hirschiana VP5]
MRIIPPNSIVSASFSQNIADMRARATIVSQESVTGQYADLTKHLGGRIGDAMISDKALLDIEHQRGLLGVREGRLDLTQQSLAGVQERISGLEVQMLTALGVGDVPGKDLVSRDAKAALSDVFSALNSRHGDRFLFSGDETATQPFSNTDQLLADIRQIASTAIDAADFEVQLDDYFQSPTGGWQTSIYGGTSLTSDQDSVTATDPAIVEIISGLAVMAISGSADNLTLLTDFPEIVRESAERIGTGTSALVNLRADVGIIQERVAKAKEALDTEETILNSVHNNIVGRDQYDAASELKQLEASLEAAYVLTSRLSNLSLLNFLR